MARMTDQEKRIRSALSLWVERIIRCLAVQFPIVDYAVTAACVLPVALPFGKDAFARTFETACAAIGSRSVRRPAAAARSLVAAPLRPAANPTVGVRARAFAGALPC